MNAFGLKSLAMSLMFAACAAHADILIGQTADFSGPVAAGVKEAAAGAKLYITPALSFDAKFDGEFASGSQTYAGTGTLRYSW